MQSSWSKRISAQAAARGPQPHRRQAARAAEEGEQEQLAPQGGAVAPRGLPLPPAEANVPQDIVRQLTSPSSMCTPFCHALLQSSVSTVLDHCARDQSVGLDEHTTAMAQFFLRQRPQLHASREAISQVTNVPRAKIEACLSTLANAILHTDQVQRRVFEQAIVNSNVSLIAYFEVSRYDETPMKVSQRQQLGQSSTSAPSSRAPASSPVIADRPGSSIHPHDQAGVSLPAVAVISKLFAVENRFAILVKVNNVEDTSEPAGKYVLFQGVSLTPLHIVDRATAECLQACLLESSHATDASNQFRFKARTTTTDQAGSNQLAEKAVLSQRPGWSGLHLPCNVHLVANAFSRTFAFVDEHITGLIGFSLSLSFGSSMLAFRKSLIAAVSLMPLEIVEGTPPPDVVAYRQHVLELFGGTGRNLEVKRFLLQTFPNGDWRRKHSIQVYVEAGAGFEREALLEKLGTVLALSLTGTLFRVYPRHRWIGADQTVDQIGLCEAVHGLASAAYHHMMTGQLPSAATSSPASLGANAAVDNPSTSASARGGVLPAEQPSADPDIVDPPPHLPPYLDNQGGAGQTLEQGPGDMAQQNAKAQKKALEWLGSSPLPTLMMMRMLMEPLTHLLRTYMSRSSQGWQSQERAGAARSFLDSEDPPTQATALSEYLRQVAEEKFLDELWALIISDRWLMLEQRVWTLKEFSFRRWR